MNKHTSIAYVVYAKNVLLTLYVIRHAPDAAGLTKVPTTAPAFKKTGVIYNK